MTRDEEQRLRTAIARGLRDESEVDGYDVGERAGLRIAATKIVEGIGRDLPPVEDQ